MKSIPIIDGHIDLAWNYCALNRFFIDSIEKKQIEENKYIIAQEGKCSVGFPEMRRGNVRILFGTIWVETKESLYPSVGPKYHSMVEAKLFAQRQFQYYRKLEQEYNIKLVTNVKMLRDVLYSSEYQCGIIPIIEGADFIENADDLQYWRDLGVKIYAPIWQKNQFGGCSEFGDGLTEAGEKFIAELNNGRNIIDIAHMSKKSADRVLLTSSSIVINTHTACKHFVNNDRLIDDFQIHAIHKLNGVIGLMTWNKQLKSNNSVSLDDYIDHIDYISDITGSVENIAIGSSMDGGYGTESLPIGMKSIESLNLIGDKMLSRGYCTDDIENVFFKNWERILKQALNQ